MPRAEGGVVHTTRSNPIQWHKSRQQEKGLVGGTSCGSSNNRMSSSSSCMSWSSNHSSSGDALFPPQRTEAASITVFNGRHVVTRLSSYSRDVMVSNSNRSNVINSLHTGGGEGWGSGRHPPPNDGGGRLTGGLEHTVATNSVMPRRQLAKSEDDFGEGSLGKRQKR